MSDEETGIYRSDDVAGNPKKPRSFSRVFLGAACAVTTAIIMAILLGVTFAKYQKVSTAPSQQEVSSYIVVHHAASLKSVMTKIINPAFTAKYNIGVITVSNSSGILAKGLKAGATADVFISADSKITDTLLLQKVKPVVSWYSYWVCSSVGLAYNTGSKYSSVFRSIAKGTVPWYKAINSTMKIGRTNPDHDPKGYRSIIMARLAEIHYKETGIEKRIFSSNQIYPYGQLEDLLDKGTIDIGFFYKHENFWNSTGNQEFITLSPFVDMSDMTKNSYYEKANYTNSDTKAQTTGSAVAFTVSIPTTSTNSAGAIKYIQFLKSKASSLEGLLAHGLTYASSTPEYVGDISSVPAGLTASN